MSTVEMPAVAAERDAAPLPSPPRRPPWVPEELFPFASRFVDVDGARLHYVDEGAGPALVLVPGSPMWSFMYRRVIASVKNQYRVVAVDLPGLGLSRAPLVRGRAFERNADWLEGFVGALGLDRYCLVVHATGGPSALAMAARHPGALRGLVVSNSFAWPLVAPARLAAIVRVVSSFPFAVANVHLNLLGRLTARLGRRTGPFDARERAAVLGPFQDVAVRRHLQNLLLGVRVERRFFELVERDVERLRAVPTLFSYGMHDNGYAAGFLDRWKALLPRHDVTLLRDSAHFPLEDEPERFIETLRGWLRANIDG